MYPLTFPNVSCCFTKYFPLFPATLPVIFNIKNINTITNIVSGIFVIIIAISTAITVVDDAMNCGKL